MEPLTKREIQELNQVDRVRVILYLLWLHTRKPALPRPVHFGLVASLCMFALLPAMPHHPLSIPTVIGAGVAFALLIQGGNYGQRRKGQLPEAN